MKNEVFEIQKLGRGGGRRVAENPYINKMGQCGGPAEAAKIWENIWGEIESENFCNKIIDSI